MEETLKQNNNNKKKQKTQEKQSGRYAIKKKKTFLKVFTKDHAIKNTAGHMVHFGLAQFHLC